MSTETITFADLSNINVGDTATCRTTITERHIDTFAALSEDDNRLHMENEVAQSYGFQKRVAHGMLSLSMISRLIGTQLPGHGSLWVSEDLQFAVAVFVGDELEAKVTVQQVSKAAQLAVLTTEVVKVESGAVVLRGTAKVRVAPRKAST
jgi:acyl dehydratase